MTTVDRYLLREIAVPFAVGLGLFFAVITFGQLLKMSDSVTGMGVDGSVLIEALFYSLPPVLGLLIPVSGLFATLLGVGRLAADREVLGMCAGGLSPYRLLMMPLVIGGFLAIASGLATTIGEPWGVQGLRDLMARSAQTAIASGVKVGQFNEWVPEVMFFARSRQGEDLVDVVFSDRRDSERPVVISAHYGTVEQGEQAGDIVFRLRDGTVLSRDKDSASIRTIHFQTSLYRLDVAHVVGRKARNLTTAQALDLMTLWQESQNPETSAGKRALYTITLHRRLAIPIATIIFALLAVPLASRKTGGARARGFLISSGIVGAYYYIGRAAELAARNGRIDPVFAAWLPNLLGIAALCILLVRFRRSAV